MRAGCLARSPTLVAIIAVGSRAAHADDAKRLAAIEAHLTMQMQVLVQHDGEAFRAT